MIAEACFMTRKTVRGALATLERDGFIRRDEPFGAQRGHRITICEWDTYNAPELDKGTLSNPLSNPLTTHKQECIKNENNGGRPPGKASLLDIKDQKEAIEQILAVTDDSKPEYKAYKKKIRALNKRIADMVL